MRGKRKKALNASWCMWWVSFHLLLTTKPTLFSFLFYLLSTSLSLSLSVLLLKPPQFQITYKPTATLLSISRCVNSLFPALDMEFYAYPSHSSARRPSFSFSNLVGRVKEIFSFAVSAILGNVFSAIFTFFFALVGTMLGAMTGALIGQETESGFVRGAAVGAISGAVFSIEVFESSLVLWQSDESGIGCLLYLIDVIASLLSGRLVRERIGPAMLSAVQSQMGAVEASYDEAPNIFDTGGSKGLPGDSVERIPKITITSDNNIDASGEKVSCSVCLQDFQLGETVRSLPHCHHMFHLPCIDKWLLAHGSCPLCRRDL